jgi:hypothetical protein
MTTRKLNLDIELCDSDINSIEDLEREILAQDIIGKIAEKYLYSLQQEIAQQTAKTKGSKRIHIKTTNFEFNFKARRALDKNGKKNSL